MGSIVLRDGDNVLECWTGFIYAKSLDTIKGRFVAEVPVKPCLVEGGMCVDPSAFYPISQVNNRRQEQ